MIYPVYIYGSPSLRKPSEDVAKDYPGLKELAADMFETMYASDGVGLAAPQIGKNIRMVVMDASVYADDDPSLADFKKVLINPEIYETSDHEVLMNEGCLSVPGIHEDVYRPETVRIRYLDENFELHEEVFEGFPARIAQHECDHLEGQLFTDKLSPLRKTLLTNKLSGMAKGKFKASYRTKQVK